MATTTLGIKADDALRLRLKAAAERTNRSVHWLIKQSILSYLDRLDRDGDLPSLPSEVVATPPRLMPAGARGQPFWKFASSLQSQTVLRAAITAAYRRPETECLPMLIDRARCVSLEQASRIQALAQRLVQGLRDKGQGGGVEGLIHEFSLSSQEGVALMCLAEALLRIPDKATRDALIRDKISKGDWRAHLGQSPSMFVNATTWGLLLTGRLVSTNSEGSLSSALGRLIGKGGEPLVRKGVDMAMRMMGEQFVTGQTIADALANSRRYEIEGFRYSYDMLGEAAVTADDARRYFAAYDQAIHAIGKAANRRGIYEGPGISIKLSALHPRYSRAQQARVLLELLPRLRELALLARSYDIGLNIDAEEADRLEISLDLLQALCLDEALTGWNGIGFVVQAYQKRCPYVIDWLIDLARRSDRRIMVRLVKGAYWDTEIKRAQSDGLDGYPVFTRKLYTDVSYLACARRLLAAPDAIYPQFATHNAQTLAAIYHMAGDNYYAGQYEFQCLHGMGEPLYGQVTGRIADGKLARPCRIYAPVGMHESLLAYLVRRLLENGANTSFVNRIADADVPIFDLVADPVAAAQAIEPPGLPHPLIPLPADLYAGARVSPARRNAAGLDLSNEQRLASLATGLLASTGQLWSAGPMVDASLTFNVECARPVINPADRLDVVGYVQDASDEALQASLQAAQASAPIWQATTVSERAACLLRAASLLEDAMPTLMGLIVREAGKSLPNAVAEVREAVDFLRYYAAQIEQDFSNDTHRPLGIMVCISPWNFPLAIFIGQVAAALAAGNVVLAKPAEQTPLIASEAVRLLWAAGVPGGALQLLPGPGESVGAALVGDARVGGVLFTGSTEVARVIARQLAQRVDVHGQTLPLIAETGGQNAMVVDSSALAEQVVADVLQSAFDSAGQRCSALRLLCVQEEAAPRLLEMLRGAMAELSLGNPDRLETDVGPVIDAQAQAAIEAHISRLSELGCPVYRASPAVSASGLGYFVTPTLIEIDSVQVLKREVFGPVLHVLRFKRQDLEATLAQINATGYGLTFGVHSRINETIDRTCARIHAGNVYVNRNTVGAVVGVQPFGGEGLSGTGPKAGGPLYLRRLLAVAPAAAALAAVSGERPDGKSVGDAVWATWMDWLGADNASPDGALARCKRLAVGLRSGQQLELEGPTGERNVYSLASRGEVLCVATTLQGACAQLTTVLAAGGSACFVHHEALSETVPQWLLRLPAVVAARVRSINIATLDAEPLAAVLFEGYSDALLQWQMRMAAYDGPIVTIQGLSTQALHSGQDYAIERLLLEKSRSINTAAAGGNASLMSIG